jgi:SnoaL-like domain
MDNASVQLLLDRAEISDVQLRYATGVDMRDWKLFRSCFAEEIEVDFTSVFGGSGPRKVSGDQWAEAARRTVSGFKTTQHLITNHVITVDGDKALCVAYLQAQHCLPNEQGDSMQTIGGYYTNHFIRTPHGWKIRSCKLTMTWSKGNWGIFELARERAKATEEDADTQSP